MKATIEKLTNEIQLLGRTLAIGKNNQKAIKVMIQQGTVRVGGAFHGQPWYEFTHVNKSE